MTKTAMLGLLAILIAGCETTPVYFRNSTTGLRAQYGPYRRFLISLPAMILQNDCMKGLQGRGYEPIGVDDGATQKKN